MAAARCQPVTPPIFMASGMPKSEAPAATQTAISCGPHQFSPIWMRERVRVRIWAWPAWSSAEVGSSTQYRPSPSSAWMRELASATDSAWL